MQISHLYGIMILASFIISTEAGQSLSYVFVLSLCFTENENMQQLGKQNQWTMALVVTTQQNSTRFRPSFKMVQKFGGGGGKYFLLHLKKTNHVVKWQK